MSTDTTILGVLAVVLSGVGGAGMWLLRSLLTDVLATNRALREALAGMGQRMRDHMLELELAANMVEDIHREVCGGKRTSEYEVEREKLRSLARQRKEGNGS